VAPRAACKLSSAKFRNILVPLCYKGTPPATLLGLFAGGPFIAKREILIIGVANKNNFIAKAIHPLFLNF
jgi:hypothetical protein